MADPVSLSQAITAQLAQRSMQYATPQTIPYIQRSAALADALQRMRSQGGDNIRTPTALGTNLLAEGLLQFAAAKSQKALLAREQADQSAYADALTAGLSGLPGASASGGGAGAGAAASGGAAPSPTGPTPAPASSPDPFGGGGDGSAPPPPPPPPTADNGPPPEALAAAIAGKRGRQAEMYQDLVKGGLPPVAAAGLVGNFVQESGPGLDHDNPAEGAIGAANWRANRAQAAQQFFAANGGPTIANQAAFTLQELHGPERRTMAALMAAQDPQSAAAAALGFERPAGWKPGVDPSKVSGWGNRLAAAQSVYGAFGSPQQQSPAAQVGNGPAPPSGPAQPYQVASNGPTPPPPPQGPQGAQGAPPQPMPQPGPSAGPGGPQGGYTAPPTGLPATPAEMQMINAYLHSPYPALRDQGAQMAMAIRQRMVTPQEPPKDMAWDTSQGRFVPKPGTTYQTVSSGPAGVTQADPFGQYHTTSNSNVGPLPQGAVAANGPGGPSVRLMQGMGTTTLSPAEAQAAGYGPGAVVERDALTGQTTVRQPSQVTPDMVFSQQKDFLGGKSYETALHSINAVNSLQRILASAKANNGLVDMSAIDNLLQAQTGLSARQGGVQLLLEHTGFPAQVQGFISNLFGQGAVPTDQVRQALTILQQYGNADLATAQRELDARNASMRQLSGGRFSDIGVQIPQIEPLPSIPWLGVGGAAGGGGGGQQPVGPGGSRPPPPPMSIPPGFTTQGVPPGAPMGTMRNQQNGKFYVIQNGQRFEWRPQ